MALLFSEAGRRRQRVRDPICSPEALKYNSPLMTFVTRGAARVLRTVMVAAMAAAMLTALVPHRWTSEHMTPGTWVHSARVRVQRDVIAVSSVDIAALCRPRIETDFVDPEAALSYIHRILTRTEFLRAPPLPL